MLSLDTRIQGDPDSIRKAADWLRELGEAAGLSTADTKNVVEGSVRCWRDDKADEYRERWDSGGRNAAKLADQIDLYVKVYDKCADALQTARSYMRQARELATGPPYLEMSGDLILYPERGEDIPSVNYASSGVDENFERRLLAYREAEGLVQAAYDTIRETLMHLGRPVDSKDLPRFFTDASYVNSAVGALAKAYEQTILARGEQTAASRGTWAGVLRSLDAPDLAAWVDGLADEDLARAQAAVKPYTGIGKTVDLAGKAILGIGVGYNIFVHGEPWDKAILEGASSYAGGIIGTAGGAVLGGGAGAGVSAMFGGAPAPVLVPVGAVSGMFAGGIGGSKMGEHYGAELYERLERKTLIDDPDYFK